MVSDRIELEIREEHIELELKDEHIQLELKDAIVVHPDYETYKGEYEVTPLLYEATTLDTKNKVLEDDVTVLEIPYSETSNTAGGYTIFLGRQGE